MNPAHVEAIAQAADFVGRCGPRSFTIGYLVDDPKPGVANWYASAEFRKGELTTLVLMTPVEAAEALADMLRKNATCTWCGRTISWGERRGGYVCCWRKVGARWARGCPKRDAPMITERP